ncbi:MAG: hypothetical protein K9N47_18165 [Prosthecobacter sp.]|uniref:hypothetical protein n=1 Tax=Prosthecobacter sp. TaxID=1965333 RepID=UPI0025ED0250|nr:hypothetical protein [Prosthecobacter sp.]MCF7788053.1 hypothetical protein [Prosthecobacter sp.]
MKTAATFSLLLLTSMLHAGPRTSTNYSMTTDITDAGGRRATSVNYTNDGSAGGVTGIATVASPSETAKSGYVGQLYEVAAVQVAATPTTVNEGSTRQLAASATLDDGTTLASLASSVSWSVVSGPISGISTSGLATAGNVYQDTAATVQGSYFGASSTLGLTILNTGNDDLGIYAGDGIDDPWQVQYFGQNNPHAAAGFVSDASGLTNLFKYTAGLVPNDSSSRFLLHNAPVPNQPGQMQIVISPRLSDRTYTVKASPTLGSGAAWNDLTSFSISDNGTERTITDLDATGARKFYHVEITKP